MSILNDVIAKIEEQQKGYEDTTIYICGEQLKDICRESDEYAELVLQDLNNPEMSIKKCESKIADFAKTLSKKHGGGVGVSCNKADEIIREFYGIGAKIENKQSDEINLLDFLG